MSETPTLDANISGAKIAPLDSFVKANTPHDSHSSMGDVENVSKTRIEPLAEEENRKERDSSTTNSMAENPPSKSTAESVKTELSEKIKEVKDKIVDATHSA